MSLKSMLDKLNQIEEAVEKTATGLKHTGSYGKSFDDDETDDAGTPQKKEPEVKRGRGRPRKDSGEPRWDTETLASWIIGNRPKKLPGKATVKHKLKEWMDQIELDKLGNDLLTEGRMAEVHAILHDIASGEISLDSILNKPETSEEKYASMILRNMMNDVGSVDELFDRIKADFGDDLNEVALDQSQVAVPQIKGTGQVGATTPPAQAGATTGAAVIDFKDPRDPLKTAIQQAVKNKEVSVIATESISEGRESEAEKLQKILANYPMEHRMAQEGWGIHEGLYQALCDHYWDCGRIPREKMNAGGQDLRSWVEECWATDTLGREQVDEVIPAIGAALGGMAGRALAGAAGVGSSVARSAAGAVGSIVGSNLADKMQQTFEEEHSSDVSEEKWISGAIKKPGAFTAKAKSHGMSTKEFIRHVLANKDDFPTETVRQANLAKTLSKFEESTHKDAVVAIKQGVTEEIDTGEYDARKSQPSSKEKNDEIFKRHHERMEKLKKEMDDEDEKKEGVAEGSRIPTLKHLMKKHGQPLPKDTYEIVTGYIDNDKGIAEPVYYIDYNGRSVFGPYNNISSADRKLKQLAMSGHNVGESVEQGVAEGSEHGLRYAETLARKVFDENPNLDTTGRADELLDAGFAIAKQDLGKRAVGFFRDEDFPSDFVSEYDYLKQQGVAEGNSQHSHQYTTTMKHAKNPTVQQRMAAHDIKPGIAGYRDRVDMLKDLERTGRLKENDGYDSVTFWKKEAKKAGGANNIDWYAIGVEHGKQGILMNPPYGVGAKAVNLYGKGLDAGKESINESSLNEIASSKKQRRAAAIALKVKTGKLPKDQLKGASKSMADMSAEELRKIASTKEAGLPEKVSESDSQMTDWDNQLTALLAEGLTVTTSTGNKTGGDSVSVNATDEDAATLMKLIQNSGIVSSQAVEMGGTDSNAPAEVVTVEPVTHDEVMGALEPDDSAQGEFDFIKRMIGARQDHSGHEHNSDYESEDVCGDCGHKDCRCPDHGEIDEADNYEATQHSSSDHSMSPVPEDLKGNQVKLDVAPPHGKLTAADFAKLRKDGVKEGKLNPEDFADTDDDELGEEALDQPATFEEMEKCEECGGGMYEGHECGSNMDEVVTEWANKVGGNSSDESYITDMEFMTKNISGGLNNMKQDQTVLPSTRVKTGTEHTDTANSMAEMLRKLSNIN